MEQAESLVDSDVKSMFGRLGLAGQSRYFNFTRQDLTAANDAAALRPGGRVSTPAPSETAHFAAVQNRASVCEPGSTESRVEAPACQTSPATSLAQNPSRLSHALKGAQPIPNAAHLLLSGGTAAVDGQSVCKDKQVSQSANKEAHRVLEEVPRVVFHSPQGGAGVTTLAAGLSAYLALSGLSPVILDMHGGSDASMLFDRSEKLGQLGASLLYASCVDATVGMFSPRLEQSNMTVPVSGRRSGFDLVGGESIEEACVALISRLGGHGFLVFDMPAARHDLWRSTLHEADATVVPLRPDIHAFRAAESMLKALDDKQGGVLFVLNGYDQTNDAHCRIESSLRAMLGTKLAARPIHHDSGLTQAQLGYHVFKSAIFSSAGFHALSAHCALAALKHPLH